MLRTPAPIVRAALLWCAAGLLVLACAMPLPAADGQEAQAGQDEEEPMIIRGKVMYFNPDGTRSIKGDLFIVNGESKITADEGEYNQEDGTAVARGTVRVTEPGSELTCGELQAFLEENRNLARGNPVLTRITESREDDGSTRRTKVVLKAEVIEILDGRKLIRATDRVRLNQEDIVIDQKGLPGDKTRDSSMVVCEYMEIFDDGKRLEAKGGVEVRSADFIATGEKATFFDSDQRMEIYGATQGDTAKAWQSVSEGEFAEVSRGNVRGRGQRIIYHGADEILNIIGEAKTWRAGERNFVEGEKIIHYVREDRTVVLGGEGLYYSGPEQEKPHQPAAPAGITGEEQEFQDLELYR